MLSSTDTKFEKLNEDVSRKYWKLYSGVCTTGAIFLESCDDLPLRMKEKLTVHPYLSILGLLLAGHK